MSMSINSALKILRENGIAFTAAGGFWRLTKVSLSSPELVRFAGMLLDTRGQSADALREKLSQRLSHLNWPPRVMQAFSNEQLLFLGDLCITSCAALKRNPGIGRQTIENIRRVIKPDGLDLEMELPWWDSVREHLISKALDTRSDDWPSAIGLAQPQGVHDHHK